jgi:hypothetical protein
MKTQTISSKIKGLFGLNRNRRGKRMVRLLILNGGVRRLV